MTADRRLATKSTRNDFLSTVVRNYEDGKISKEEMTAHVSTLTYVFGPLFSRVLCSVSVKTNQEANLRHLTQYCRS